MCPETSNKLSYQVVALCILLTGLCLRLVYAWNLPINSDEQEYMALAAKISLLPGSFFLPMGKEAFHPLFAVYLTAIGLWAGNGSLFVCRVLFVLLSMAGLAGVFMLSKSFFGNKAGLVALLIAACCQHHIASACSLLGSKSYLFAVPWLILLFYQAVETGSQKYWLLLGLLFGISLMFYGLAALLLPPFVLWAFASGNIRKILKNPAFYAGVVLCLAVLAPQAIWSLVHKSPGAVRAAGRFSDIGLTPRVLLLYLGDILLCLKSTSWAFMNEGSAMYLPFHVPCHPFLGVGLLGSVAWAILYIRDKRILFLVLCFFLAALPPAFLDKTEGWNRFWWASITLFPAMALCSFFVDKLLRKRGWQIAAVIFLVGVTTTALIFVSGPKYGTAWCTEHRFLARAYLSSKNPAGFGVPGLFAMAQDHVKKHPNSSMGYFYLGLGQSDPAFAQQCWSKALELDPANPAVLCFLVKSHMEDKEWSKAWHVLSFMLQNGLDYWRTFLMMSLVEYRLNNFQVAASHAQRAAGMAHSKEPYIPWFFALHALGKEKEADNALKTYAFWDTDEPHKEYLAMGKILFSQGDTKKAAWCYAKAKELDPGIGPPPWGLE